MKLKYPKVDYNYIIFLYMSPYGKGYAKSKLTGKSNCSASKKNGKGKKYGSSSSSQRSSSDNNKNSEHFKLISFWY